MLSRLRYLLLQIRNPSDPMRRQEVECFARVLGCDTERIEVCDLLTARPAAPQLARSDLVLLGGSGDYSVASEGEWLDRSMDVLRDMVAGRKPMFASCWGFQALARALGGEVVHDRKRAELGTMTLRLTEAGKHDPVFAPLGDTFHGQAGHEDRVVRLPPGAVRLAFSELVDNQAYRLEGLPIYATQFHPELDLLGLRQRLEAYPRYVEQIAGVPIDEFIARCHETPETEALLRRFVMQICE